MTRLARSLGIVALAGSAFLGGTADANCVGTQNTATACTAPRPVYEDCVYTGGDQCEDVVVNGPTCIYGSIGRHGQYQTVFC